MSTVEQSMMAEAPEQELALAKPLPSDEELSQQISVSLQGRDLATITIRGIRAELVQHFGLQTDALEEKREEIGALVKAELVKISAAQSANEAEADEGNGDGADEARSADGSANDKTPERPSKRRRIMKGAGSKISKTDRLKFLRRKIEKLEDAKALEADAQKGPVMTREQFLAAMVAEKTDGLVVKIGDSELKLPVKLFASGSIGFYANAPIKLQFGDAPAVEVRCQLNCAVIGSKDWL
jgi:hypothetical protein